MIIANVHVFFQAFVITSQDLYASREVLELFRNAVITDMALIRAG